MKAEWCQLICPIYISRNPLKSLKMSNHQIQYIFILYILICFPDPFVVAMDHGSRDPKFGIHGKMLVII